MTPHGQFRRDPLLGSNFAFQRLPFGEFLDCMARSGVDRIELWGIAPHLGIAGPGPARVRAIAREMADAGVALHCLTPEQVAYPVNIAPGDAGLRAASLAHFIKAAGIAADLGGRCLFLTCGRGHETAPAQEAWDRAAEALSRIVAHAASLGLHCLLEPLQRRESNIVRTAAELDRMIATVGHPALGAVLDVCAMAAAGDDVAAYADRFGPRQSHVHLADGTPARHLAWGDGSLPLDAIPGGLAAAGYGGTFAFAPFGDGSYALYPVAAWDRNRGGLAPWLGGERHAA
ncbi:sugar phosphate isomerase/epimerase [Mangrovicoccus sp. HB161399]|uniref:sugar phosphate isomerase/epimerase family protein n=1 Tax=Mangrovicoccus sp. HB161399 TaxID=2720392 RepID=UPI001557966B|nr:sugar phosphate isomerase/epimerase family protein [Mangrovicoccus sp. HB161399]